MATIVTRAGKGSPLTNNELDDNFINLNDQADANTADITANTAAIATKADASALAAKVTQETFGIDNAGPLYYNSRTINQNVTIGGTDNVLSAGPMVIGDGYTVTIEDGGEWVIV